jgi:xanthine dehydrogenase YagS FAD-binding subunit
MAVALAALDATIHATGPDGERDIPILDLHRLPGDEPERDTTLAANEVITAVTLPPLPVAANSRYVKVRERATFSFAVVSVAAALTTHDRAITDVRIALGGVAHKPWRASIAERVLTGAEATVGSFTEAADQELARAQPLRDTGYKVPIAKRLIVETLTALAGAA